MKDEREIERLLGQFSPRPAPTGLRERIIRAAENEVKARLILTPAWRWTLAASLVLLASAILADWRLSSREQHRLSSLLDAPERGSVSPANAADKRAEELLACLPELDSGSRQALRQGFAKAERAASQARHSAALVTEGINDY